MAPRLAGLPCALLRWGAGREAALGLAVILVWLGVTHVADPTSPDEVVAGYGFFLFSAARRIDPLSTPNTRLRDIEQAKLRLRNELARELHDTVGHDVLAIAIQAQAGRAMAASDPDRALAVLETIEDAASRIRLYLVGSRRSQRTATGSPIIGAGIGRGGWVGMCSAAASSASA